MITIPLTTEDLTKVRLAPSPLWETVISFGVLCSTTGATRVHAPWATRARRVLPGTDLSPLLAAMCLEKHCPDFLTPPPTPRSSTSRRNSSALVPRPLRSCIQKCNCSCRHRKNNSVPSRPKRSGCWRST